MGSSSADSVRPTGKAAGDAAGAPAGDSVRNGSRVVSDPPLLSLSSRRFGLVSDTFRDGQAVSFLLFSLLL